MQISRRDLPSGGKSYRQTAEAIIHANPANLRDENLSQIEYLYRKLLAFREVEPDGDATDDDRSWWVDEHDAIEDSIGYLRSRSLADVQIKMNVLCERLRENVSPGAHGSASDLMLAQAARDDLAKLSDRAAVPHATGIEEQS